MKRKMRCVAHCVDGVTFEHIREVCYKMYPERQSTIYQNSEGYYFMYCNLTSSEFSHLTLVTCRRILSYLTLDNCCRMNTMQKIKEKRKMLVVADNVDFTTYTQVFNLCKELYPRRKSFTYSLVGGKYFLKYNLSVSELAHLTFEYCTRFGLVRR